MCEPVGGLLGFEKTGNECLQGERCLVSILVCQGKLRETDP